MKPDRYHRLRRPDGGLGPIVQGDVPAGVEATCEGVVWMQLSGRRQAVRGELWSETETGGQHRVVSVPVVSRAGPLSHHRVVTDFTPALDKADEDADA